MDDELKQALEAMQAESRRRFDEMEHRFGAMEDRFDALHAEHAKTRRHFDVVAEHLESKIATIAEGVVACNERIDRTNEKLDDFSAATERNFNDIRSMIQFSHHELDRRIRTLEKTISE